MTLALLWLSAAAVFRDAAGVGDAVVLRLFAVLFLHRLASTGGTSWESWRGCMGEQSAGWWHMNQATE